MYLYFSEQKNGTLYTGVTSDLVKRVYEHKQEIFSGFTKRYNIKMLVYYEIYEDMTQAIKREKTLKGCLRKRKIELIEKNNKNWDDLYDSLL